MKFKRCCAMQAMQAMPSHASPCADPLLSRFRLIINDQFEQGSLPFSGERADRWIDVACQAKIASLASLLSVSLMLLYNGLGTGLPLARQRERDFLASGTPVSTCQPTPHASATFIEIAIAVYGGSG
jgi:hypothetical protein